VRYVLVPVPSEYVLDVMRWVLFRAPDEQAGNETGRDLARVESLLSELDDFMRSLLLLVAKSVAADDALKLTDAADELDRRPQDVSDAVRAINLKAVWGKDVVTLRSEPAVGVRGQHGRASVLTMHPDIARLVRAATRSASVSDD
jgi:hypothetical protein